MSVKRIANRYAKSLLDLARETKQLAPINTEVRDMLQLIEEQRDLYLLVKSPIVSEEKKVAIFRQLFEDKLSELMMTFLDIVIRKKRETFLLDIFQAFIEQYNALKGITPVTLTTAVPVNDDFQQQVIELMQQEFNKQTIELTTAVDDELVGGFVLQFEDKRLDASVAHQLEELRKEFHKNTQFKNQ